MAPWDNVTALLNGGIVPADFPPGESLFPPPFAVFDNPPMLRCKFEAARPAHWVQRAPISGGLLLTATACWGHTERHRVRTPAQTAACWGTQRGRTSPTGAHGPMRSTEGRGQQCDRATQGARVY